MSNTEKTLIKVTGVPEHFNLPWLLAIEDGAFAQAGLDVEWIDEPGGTGAMSKALYHEEVDVALLLTEGALTSLLSGDHAMIHSVYVDSPLVWGVFAGANSDKNLEDLRNQSFAISRFYSGSHLMGHVYASSYERKVEEENFEVVGGLEGARELLRKDPNHLFLWEKLITLPYVYKGEFKLVDEIASPWSSFLAVVCKKVWEEKKAAVDRMMAIVREYALDLQESGEEGAELIAHIYEMKGADAQEWLDDVRYSKTGEVSDDMLLKTAETLASLGILDKVPSLEKLQSLQIQH